LGERGPFHLGKYSWSVNVVSAAFTLFVCILFILPTSTPVTAINMNYAIVAIGGVLLLILISWFAYGVRHYKGPVSTVDMIPKWIVLPWTRKNPNAIEKCGSMYYTSG